MTGPSGVVRGAFRDLLHGTAPACRSRAVISNWFRTLLVGEVSAD